VGGRPAAGGREENLVEAREERAGLGSEQARGKAGHGGVGVAKLGWKIVQGFPMQANGFEIAAREGTGPGGAGAEDFLVIEHLAGEAEEGASGLAALEPRGQGQLNGCLQGNENVGGGKGAGAMVFGLAARGDASGFAAEAADHLTYDAEGLGMALDSEEDAIELGAGAGAEGLHGVDDADPGAMVGEGMEGGGGERAAGMDDDFARQFFSGEALEAEGNFGERVVGDGEEDDAGVEEAAGETGDGDAGPDGANRGARRGQIPRDDGANLPAGLAQTRTQAARYAACTDKRNGAHGRIV